MEVIALILVTLLANPVTSRTKLATESGINVLSDLPATVFTLQIRQIETTDPAPANSPGNNLFVVGSSGQAQDIQKKHQAISTNHPFTNKIGKNSEDGNEGNRALFLSTDGNVTGNKDKNFRRNFLQDENTMKALHLTWNDCLEPIFEDNLLDKNIYSDKGNPNNNYQLPKRDEMGNLWIKRNVEPILVTDNNVGLKTSIDLKNSRNVDSQPQESDSIFIRKIIELPITNIETTASTIQIIPITREVFKDTIVQNTTQNVIVRDNNGITSYTEDLFERKDLTKIRFNGFPQGETYLLPTLRLEEGFHPFSFMSKFFDLIYPFDFPVGKY